MSRGAEGRRWGRVPGWSGVWVGLWAWAVMVVAVRAAEPAAEALLQGAAVGAVKESQFGSGLALVDVNGDGFKDLLVLAPLERPNGRIFLFLGGAQGLGRVPAWQYSAAEHRPRHTPGVIVDAGDVNGDGFGDFAVTVESGNAPVFHQVLVFHGGVGGPGAGPAVVLENRLAGTEYGLAVAAAGDVNGDGFGDLVVGAPSESSLEDQRQFMDGAVYLYLGSGVGLGRVAGWKQVGGVYNAHIGVAVSGGGDVDGDGFSDVAYGGSSFSTRLDLAGGVWVFRGGKGGLGKEPAWSGVGKPDSRTFGGSVLLNVDPRGDGVSDLVVAAHFGSRDQGAEGVVQLFRGGARGLGVEPVWRVEGNQPEIRFGFVLGGGDFNGDRRGDLVVATPYVSEQGQNRGVVCVYAGAEGGLGGEPAWSRLGSEAFEYFGAALAVGDINGDGCDDLVVGQHPFSRGSGRTGDVAIFYGGRSGLRGGGSWLPRSDRYGFDWQTFTLPIPNTAWRTAFLVGMGVGTVVLVWVSARLREARRGLVFQTYERAQAEERTRIARDLHDHLGGYLTRISLGCGLLKQEVGSSMAAGVADRISGDAAEAVQTVSEIVWATNPEHDRLDHFIDFLADTGVRLFESTSIRLVLELDGVVPGIGMESKRRHQVYLAAKEAMNNALKHSGGTQVVLGFRWVEPGWGEIRVRDNGIGRGCAGGKPEAGPTRPGGGNGLGNMKGRMEAVGGVFEVRGAEGTGTEVVLRFPVGGAGDGGGVRQK